ncbi:MAG: GNAT family N-acetyltransferase [Rhabdochlamydiaceae bacterium]|nr:GNAT family N-acetyltransferase [Rhabdochlamydiaceae bacterium]
MSTFKALQELESLYDKMLPAQENSKEAFAWFSGIPHPLFNAVMHLSTNKSLESKVADLISQGPNDIPLSFWVHNQNGPNDLVTVLKEKGFQSVVTCFLMNWDIKPTPLPSHQIQIADLEIFHNLLATVFHFDEPTKNGLAKLLANVQAENYVLYLNGTPVGAGTLIPNKTTGGIFNIAILPEHQKKGLGRSMMQFLMNRASILGLENLVLLSSPASEKLYSELMFTKCCDIEIYVG